MVIYTSLLNTNEEPIFPFQDAPLRLTSFLQFFWSKKWQKGEENNTKATFTANYNNY